MAKSAQGGIFCYDIGNTTKGFDCCFPDNQGAQICSDTFLANTHTTFSCLKDGDCIAACRNVSSIYVSLNQIDPYQGDGQGPIHRYQTCANVPAMAGYLSQENVLEPNISSAIAQHMPVHTSVDDLMNITSGVTECLTATCHNARNDANCSTPCAAVNLLLNYTTPNVTGINECLGELCNGRYNSLPFADADVVGIGVFASYLMQCMFVVVLWLGLSGFEFYNHCRRRRRHAHLASTPERMPEKPKPDQPGQPTPPEAPEAPEPLIHQRTFEAFLVEFHKSQCYFSATIQIASLAYGIFTTDMLITFMLTPLATNGVLPVVFAFVLLFRCGKSTMDATILTTFTWLLASIVYWILYSNIIPINQDIRGDQKRYRAYQQFMYKLSALDACGGFSALAVCPDNFYLGRDDIFAASHNLRVLTPIIWTFSTVCLLATLAGKLTKWRRGRGYQSAQQSEVDAAEEGTSTGRPTGDHHPPFFRSRLGASITYWLVTFCFLAGIGMQMSLLSIGTSLHMMNRMHWSFGQIVAVTIWAPPLLGYLYDELKEILRTRWGVGDIPR